jgi:hypothetical protein
MDYDALDSAFKSCSMCSPRLYLCQNSRYGTRSKFHHTRKFASDTLQRPKEGKVQKNHSISRLRHERMALRAPFQIFHGSGNLTITHHIVSTHSQIQV